MKKILLSSCMLLFLTLASIAQPSTGNFFIGGNLGMYGSSDKTRNDGTTQTHSTSFNFALLPTAGFFISDNFAVGARLGLESQVYKYPNAMMDKSTTIKLHIQPFARYYLISGNGGVFVEGMVGLSTGTRNEYYDQYTNKINSTSFSAGIRPGVYYYITPKIALEAMFGWAGFSSDVEKVGDTKDIENYYGLDMDASSLYFGFTFTL